MVDLHHPRLSIARQCADITVRRENGPLDRFLVLLTPMRRGFLYLVAIMDWWSRKVLAWRLSNTMEADFCVEALEEALARHGKPEIFYSDQGSQFTPWPSRRS